MESAAHEILADGALRIPEAVAFTGCGRTRIYEAVAAGELPTVRHGRRVAIPRRALVAWMAGRLHTHADGAA